MSTVSPVCPPYYPSVPIVTWDEHGRIDLAKPGEVGTHLIDRCFRADSADKDLALSGRGFALPEGPEPKKKIYFPELSKYLAKYRLMYQFFSK